MLNDREIANIIANDFGPNATYVEDLLTLYRSNPSAVGGEWSGYFRSLLETNGAVVIDLPAANGAA